MRWFIILQWYTIGLGLGLTLLYLELVQQPLLILLALMLLA